MTEPHAAAEWLRAVRLVPTIAWALLAGCVVGIVFTVVMAYRSGH